MNLKSNTQDAQDKNQGALNNNIDENMGVTGEPIAPPDSNENVSDEMGVDYTPTIVKAFINVYIEFEPMIKDAKTLSYIESTMQKVASIYPQYDVFTKSNKKKMFYPFCMLVAHYLVITNKASSIGLNRSVGIVSSSSIDGVSVSYQTQQTRDNFQYFFNQTPYGQEYLAYLNTQNGLMLVR